MLLFSHFTFGIVNRCRIKDKFERLNTVEDCVHVIGGDAISLSGAACKRRRVGCDEHVLDSSDVEPSDILH